MRPAFTKILVFAAAGTIAIAAGTYPASGTTGSHAITVRLKQVNGSGQSGFATLTPAGSGFTVLVKMKGRGIQPGEYDHIHNVSCKRYAHIAPNPRKPTAQQLNKQLATATIWLTNLYGGRSKTSVAQPLQSVTTGSYSINVHTATSPYMAVACGDIPQ